ncbi:MAG: TonB-dependent receptor [Acidobacteriota bacterium]|nr:TonB-dependent receptor [Acidobacteriota bacterium]
MSAQSLTGSIVGVVSDSSGGRLPGVTITLTGPALIGSQTFVSTAEGEFRFPAVPPGTYTVAFSLAGFGLVERAGVTVSVGGTSRVNVTMDVATLAESVIVSGAAPTVDVDTTRIGTNYNAQTLQSVPLERDFYDVLKATAGVTNDNLSYRATSSINGAGVRNTGYALDGVNLTDAAASYAGVRHLNFDTFEEVEVITGGMPAEVGSVAGGFVNIVTKSGGDTFKGGGSYYFANESMQSGLRESAIAQGIRPGSTGIAMLSDATLELGGPLRRAKAWFYGSYRRFDNDVVAIGYRFERMELPENNDILFGKLTLQPQQKHKVTLIGSFINRHQPQFSYIVSPFRDELGGWFLKDQGPTASAQWQWIATQTTYVETRVGAMIKQAWFDIRPDSVEPSTLDLGTNENTAAQERGQHDWRDRYQANLSVTHYREGLFGGTHDFKAGLDLSYFTHIQTDRSLTGYQRQFTNGVPTFVRFANGFPSAVARTRNIYDTGVFAQDRFTAGRLTLNLGFRFDATSVVFPEQSFGATGVFPELQSIPIYAPVDVPRMKLADWKNFSPRLGFTFDLSGDGKTPLKGSYSRYNDQVFTYLFQGPMAWRQSLHRWTDTNSNRLVDSGEFGPVISTSGTGGNVDPNSKRPYWTEFILGIERELMANFSIGTRVIYKENKDIFDDTDIGTAGGWMPVTIFDAGPDGARGTADDVGAVQAYDIRQEFLGRNSFLGVNPEGAVRRYKAVEFNGNKRFSDNWQWFGSLVISRSDGNIGNDYGGTAGATTAFNNPNTRINEYGPLGLDSTYQFKSGGTYLFPRGIEVGAIYVHSTGYPYTRQIRVSTDASGARLNAGTITINAEPLGSRRLPSQDNINMNVSKLFRLGSSRDLKLALDVFNLTNQNTPLSVASLSASTFERVTTILPPRYIRIGARYRF